MPTDQNEPTRPVDQFFKYVSKNTSLPSLRTEIAKPENTHLLSDLQNAIQTHNPNHPIFAHPYCLMLIQILYEQNKISNDSRVTLFTYLNALRTYTNWQMLRSEDQDLKVLTNVQLILPPHPHYRRYLKKYLNKIAYDLTHPWTVNRFYLNTPNSERFNKDSICDAVQGLSGFEPGLLLIHEPATRESQEHDSYKSIARIRKNTSFYLVQYFEKWKVICIPATSIGCLILNQLNPEVAFEPSPILGDIGIKTAFENFHAATPVPQQPMSIYSEHVKSNVRAVHDRCNGPFYNSLHDGFHLFAFQTLFTLKMYRFFTDELIPLMMKLDAFISQSSALFNLEESKKFRQLVSDLYDYYLLTRDCYHGLDHILIIKDHFSRALTRLVYVPFYLMDPDQIQYYQLSSFSQSKLISGLDSHDKGFLEKIQQDAQRLFQKPTGKLSGWIPEDFTKILNYRSVLQQDLNYLPLHTLRISKPTLQEPAHYAMSVVCSPTQDRNRRKHG